MGIVDPHRSCGEEYTSISVALFGSIGHFIRFKIGNLHDGNLFTHTHKSDLSLEEPCSLAPKGSGMVSDGRRRTSETHSRTIATRGVDIIKQAKDNQDTRPLFTPGSIKPCTFYQTRHVLTCATQYPPRGLLGHSTIFTYCEPSSYNTPWLSFSTKKGGYLTSSF